ncbi:class I SAM-dependent methyltransferase [Synechococcus sp. UW140]|uniref:class I SAM-dependent methyltransferase n=1 Tax=Synechococcus sp. UW140 TaxID=368503 RepID=UPI0031379E3B
MPDNFYSHFSKKYFDEIELIHEDHNYFDPVLIKVLSIVDVKNSKVLDVGCGTGLFLKPIVNAGCSQLYGVDGPQGYTDLAINRGYKEVRIISDLNVCRIPFSDQTFDFVICKDVFEHLLNPTHALSEISRVLKKEGLFLFHVPNHFPLIGRLKFLFTNSIDTFSFFKDESRWTFPHVRFYEHRDSIRVFSESNFSVVLDLSYCFQALPWLSRSPWFFPIGRFLVRRFPNQFASGFTFLLRKTDA